MSTQTTQAEAVSEDTKQLFLRDGKPSVKLFLPMALQHVIAAIVGIMTPAIIVAGACKLPAADKTMLIQSAMLFSGIVTLLQAHPAFGVIGSGLPVITGASFAFVPVLQSAGAAHGFAAVVGAQFIGGFIAMIVAVFLKQIKKLFPPVVTGTVIFCIGLSLYSVAIKYMAGGAGTPNFGSAQNWIIALITLAACIFFSNFTKGVTKLGSVLFGLLVGYGIALVWGFVDPSQKLIDFGQVAAAGWVSIPKFLPYGMEFHPDAILSVGAIFIIAAVEMIGDFSAVTNGAMDREPKLKELRGGIFCEGLASTVGALFGGLPTATFAQNVGICTTTKITNRRVFASAAVILIICGFVPKFASILSTIPQCVIGGATISVFGSITMTGIRILTKGGLSNRRATIAGLSIALGMGISIVPKCLAGPGIPAMVTSLFGGSAIVVTTLMAIVLNLILPDPDGEKARDAAEEEKQLED